MAIATFRIKVGQQWYTVEVGDLSASPIQVTVEGETFPIEVEGLPDTSPPARRARPRSSERLIPPSPRNASSVSPSDGVIRSPDDRSILQGISRGMVMDLAQQLNIPFVEEHLQPYDLYNADEVFFTGTSPCVLPCTEVDRRQVSDGKPGPITQQLLAAWSEAVGVDIVDQALRYAKR